MDPAAGYRQELRLAGVGNSPPKPIRHRRADREEIGGYGFATQDATRALLIGPPLIDHDHVGMVTLLIP
jgi:hypothetical protein